VEVEGVGILVNPVADEQVLAAGSGVVGAR